MRVGQCVGVDGHLGVRHRQLPPETHDVAALVLVPVISEPIAYDLLRTLALSLIRELPTEIPQAHRATVAAVPESRRVSYSVVASWAQLSVPVLAKSAREQDSRSLPTEP